MTARIVIGTTNDTKVRAAEEALRIAGKDGIVIPRNVLTGLNAQPVGYQETRRGARLRAQEAKDENVPGATHYLGIENGIGWRDGHWGDEEGWKDWAIAILIWQDGPYPMELSVESEAITAPRKYVEIAKDLGYKDTTWGKVSSEYHAHDPQDPHSYWSIDGKSRYRYLVEALVPMMRRL